MKLSVIPHLAVVLAARASDAPADPDPIRAPLPRELACRVAGRLLSSSHA